MRSSAAAAIVTLALGAGAAACGNGSPAGALDGKSASQILATGIAAAEAQRGVHYVLEAKGQAQTQTISGDAGRSDGVQTVQTGVDEVEVEVIAGKAYVKGNAGGLQHTLGLPAASATKYAGQWLSVAPSDSLYQPITKAVTLHGIFNQLEPTGKLESSTPGMVAGHEVIGVRGGLPGNSQGGVTGDATLYVSTASSTLPVGFTGQATTSGKQVTEVGAFTHWGEQLHLQAPTATVPFSSVPTS